MEKAKLFGFIKGQKTAFLASVNQEGYPVVRAMLAPRKIEGNTLYFTTNTSSKKIGQYTANDRACVYFYKRGLVRYRGVCLVGKMEICTDQPTKEAIWRRSDKLFYREGATDPDYCVLKFTASSAEHYCDFKTETVEL